MEHNDQKSILFKQIEELKVWKRSGKRAYHKYLLLASIINLMDASPCHENCFTFNELEPVFKFQAQKFGLSDLAPLLEYPFYYLSSDGLWNLKVRQGQELKFEYYKSYRKRFTKGRLLETVEYGYLDDKIYKSFLQENMRRKVKDRIEGALTGMLECDYELKENVSLYKHEASAIQLLCSEVQKYSLGKCINNAMIYDSSTGQYLECDVVVVGYNGIYVVELKHWMGEVIITSQALSYNWLRNGKYVRNPHISNDHKAKILKGLYQHKFITYPEIYVESVVILTNEECKVEGASNPLTTKRCPTFHTIKSFIKYLNNQTSAKEKSLTVRQIDAVRDYLVSIHKPRPSLRFVIPDYEIIEYLTQTYGLIEVIAKPLRGYKNKLYRFRRFTPIYKSTVEEKERFYKKAKNTLNAVAQIGDHPNILKVWPVPDDTDAVTEGSDWSEEGTLRDMMYQAGSEGFDETRALELCQGILSGLHAAHAKGVIHRAVKPENILMVNGVPKLMNFDLSYQLAADSSVTVIPDASSLKDDPYTPPEVYAMQDVDEATDLFSVGVILYELLFGSPPFKSSRELANLGGRLPQHHLEQLSKKGVSVRVIDFIDKLVRADRAERYRTSEQALRAIGVSKTELEEAESCSNPNRILEPGETHDIFEIRRLIGEGSEAQVYEAAKAQGQKVALKIFHKHIPLARIQREEANAGSVRSSYLAQARRLGHWKNDRYYIEMDYLDGRLMREDIRDGVRPDEETFVRVASCLLDAVTTLHERTVNGAKEPLVHGDIKPDNIMLADDGTAALFDFGCSGPPRVDTYQGTEGYVAPDLINGADLQFCESGDLFALGVSLFEWAFGKRPYTTLHVGAQPEIPSESTAALRSALITWLRKAVHTLAHERFCDARSMAKAFWEAVAEGWVQPEGESPEPALVAELLAEPLIGLESTDNPQNPFVSYLNSLHNATVCNQNALAEAQALSPYFGFIHVPLKVTDFVLQRISSPDAPHIILTGHAGDGKSTVALELFKLVQSIPQQNPLDRPLQECEELWIGERRVLLVKDMSELGDEKTLALFQKALHEDKDRYLIVSNTGALLNGFKKLCSILEGNWLELQNDLLKALEDGKPKQVPFGGKSFLIINLARTDNVSTACQVFERMLAPHLWESCENCACREHCPIYFNVGMLQDNVDIVKKRVEFVYRRLYEYGIRLTLRQLTGHLAYALTGGLGCEEIAEKTHYFGDRPVRQFLFFNRFFGDAGEIPDSDADQLEAVRQIRALQPGRNPHMGLERLIWDENEKASLPMIIDGRVKEVFHFLRRAASSRNPKDELPGWAARMQVRRILYLFGKFSGDEEERRYVTHFLNSPMLWDFCAWQKTSGKLSPLQRSHIQQAVLHVLQEQFTGIRLPENTKSDFIYITLNRKNYDIRQAAQIVLARFGAEDFEFHLRPLDSGFGEPRYEAILLEGSTGKELRLDLPFLDYVKNRFGGEIAQKLQSFFVDRLERFKVELLSAKSHGPSDNMMLVRLQLDQSFKSFKISAVDGRLEVF